MVLGVPTDTANPFGELHLDNRRALDLFLSRVEKRAYRMALVATGDADEALDVVQETMFKLAHKYAHKSEQEWTLLFYRILQSRIRDWYRRQKVRNRLRTWFVPGSKEDGEDPIESQPANTTSPDVELQNWLAIERVDRAVREMPQRQQEVIMLRLWEGLDINATAKAMGCTAGSVKTHYSRAIHKLREILAAH